MDKKYMKIGFLGFLSVCAAVYASRVSGDDDVRAAQFAEYIRADIDSMVARHLTETEIESYVNSYRDNPNLFDAWMDNLVADSVAYNKTLVRSAAAIDQMDASAGRALSFGAALRRLDAMRDTLPPPVGDDIMLKRHVDGMRFNQVNLALARAARGRAKSEK